MRRTALGLLAAAAIGAAVAAAVWPRHHLPPRSTGGIPDDVVLSFPVQARSTSNGVDSVSYTLTFGKGRSPRMTRALRVFRGSAPPGDALPANASLLRMGHVPDRGHAGSVPDAAKARRLVRGTDGVALFAAPTRDGRGICLEPWPGTTTDCGEGLAHGLLARVQTSAGGMRGRVYGVAADSVVRVVVLLRGGARLTALLGWNGFYAPLPLRPAPSGLEIFYRNGTRRLLRIEPFARYTAAPHR